MCASLFNIFLSSIYHSLDTLPGLKPSEIAPYLNILETLQETGLLARFNVDVASRVETLKERVHEVAEQSYLLKSKELFAAPGVNRALPLLLMTDVIEKNAKLLDKRFPEPLLGHLDLVASMCEIQVPMYLGDLEANKKRIYESSMNGPTPDVPIEDIFTLFRRTKLLLEMYEAFCPAYVSFMSQGFAMSDNGRSKQLNFNLVAFFEPYVLQWLLNVDNKTQQWVQAVSLLIYYLQQT